VGQLIRKAAEAFSGPKNSWKTREGIRPPPRALRRENGIGGGPRRCRALAVLGAGQGGPVRPSQPSLAGPSRGDRGAPGRSGRPGQVRPSWGNVMAELGEGPRFGGEGQSSPRLAGHAPCVVGGDGPAQLALLARRPPPPPSILGASVAPESRRPRRLGGARAAVSRARRPPLAGRCGPRSRRSHGGEMGGDPGAGPPGRSPQERTPVRTCGANGRLHDKP
jgi:hypothetical protein